MTPGLEPRALLRALLDAAIAGVAPGPAVRRALADIDVHSPRRIWILAAGKAAGPMSYGVVEAMHARGIAPHAGILVPPEHIPPPHGTVLVFPGEHPIPGPGSLAAAEAIGAVAERTERGDLVLVLLSGGASSLAGAPVGDIHPSELAKLFQLLLGSGLDIARMNVVRKRFARWGAGRLAVAIAPARVHCLAISDVPGDDVTAIGSGPCVPDPTTAPEVARILRAARLLARIPETMCTYLSAVEQGAAPETPKPGEPAFERVRVEVIARNRDALDHAAAAARTQGIRVRPAPEPLGGDAAQRGAAIARALLDAPRAGDGVWDVELHGGETTVSLGTGALGRGGRSQELALSAARVLHDAGDRADGLVLLAAGTDGRDGPTDAAGAIVDRHTWSAARDAGRDPALDLVRHDAYTALDAAGALVRTGATGTNVMDIVLALRTTE